MGKPNFSAELPAITLHQIEELKPLFNGNKTQIVIRAIAELYKQETHTMTSERTIVIRTEPVTYTSPFSDEEVTRDFEVRQCITCGEEFHTAVGSSDTNARSLYCGKHYADYQANFTRRMNNVDWNGFADEMEDGNPPQKRR